MPETPDICRLLEDRGAIRSGHFVLSSGLHSTGYCQCAALFEQPSDAQRVAEAGAGRVRSALGDDPADVVLAPALGGVLWGYELARALELRSMFAERKPGEAFVLRRGFALEKGQRVLLAEDVVTTGGSVLELVPLVESAGAEIAGIVSIVDRSNGVFKPAYRFLSLVELSLPTYEPDALPPELAAMPIERPGSRQPTHDRTGVDA